MNQLLRTVCYTLVLLLAGAALLHTDATRTAVAAVVVNWAIVLFLSQMRPTKSLLAVDVAAAGTAVTAVAILAPAPFGLVVFLAAAAVLSAHGVDTKLVRPTAFIVPTNDVDND